MNRSPYTRSEGGCVAQMTLLFIMALILGSTVQVPWYAYNPYGRI